MDNSEFNEVELAEVPTPGLEGCPTEEHGLETDSRHKGTIDAANTAVDLARKLLDNAGRMLDAAVSALETENTAWPAGLALGIARRHFRTNASSRDSAEAVNLREVGSVFRNMRLASTHASSIFMFVDDATASRNTRGFYDSEFDVAAYTYSHGHIALTNKFPSLGPNCRAAVVIHQLAHFVDPRIRDIAGVRGPAYDALYFESARLNVHCYPNFAVNAYPPFVDERYGMTRPEL